MTATLNRPPPRRAKPRPAVARKVPVRTGPTTAPTDEEQLRKDRWAAVAVFVFVVALFGLVIWAALTGDPAASESVYDYPYLF